MGVTKQQRLANAVIRRQRMDDFREAVHCRRKSLGRLFEILYGRPFDKFRVGDGHLWHNMMMKIEMIQKTQAKKTRKSAT